MIPCILKGDDSGGITVTLANGHDYADATLVVVFNGVTRKFTDLTAGGTVTLAYTAEETEGMPLGTGRILMRLIGANGGVETVDNADARIKVTDCLAEVNAGGSFTVTPGTSPLADVTGLGTRYTPDQLKAKINEVIAKLGGTVAALALALLPCLGGVTMQTAPLGEIYNDAPVVTNVTLDVSGKADKINTYTKAETDARIVELSPPTSLEPATNYTDRALSSFAATGTVARSITYGTPTRWTEDSGCVWEVGYRYDDDWVADSSRITQVSWTSAGYEDDPILWAIYFKLDGSIGAQAYTYPPGATQTNFTISASEWYSYYDGAFDFNIYRSPHTTTNLVGRVALTKDIPSAVSNVVTQAYAEGLGIATSHDVRDLARTFETNVVRAVITNRVYNLTPDYELGVVWRKTAGNGTFYERCYTNDTSIVEAAP